MDFYCDSEWVEKKRGSVKEQLGHHSIEMTVDIYGKWIKTESNKGIVNQLDTVQLSAPYVRPEKNKACNSLESQA